MVPEEVEVYRWKFIACQDSYLNFARFKSFSTIFFEIRTQILSRPVPHNILDCSNLAVFGRTR